MKKIFLFLSAICIALSSLAKEINVVVIPAEATIKVNGSYYGEGSARVKIKKNDFVSLECSAPGYETINTRVYGNDNRKTIEIKLKEDMLLKQTSESSLANNFFTVKVAKRLYKDDAKTGTRNSEQAWKLAHNILLQYFDEIQTSDLASGFIQTPWYIKTYVESGKTLRARVTIKEANIGGDLTFQIKLQSEMAPIQGRNREESYQETSRVIRELEPLISEFQTRLGEK
ncbi:MAG: PEGA domain-containing protein [Candidatus Amulumruptor caecigallinarius]|nr:PEGA domain-containing protein [Candidatus Amulumruptor caecigallinarius]MCM1396251.1 PEGA domain-containing protein [Candidatus Amulumruptor caecigallinarius]MCM1454303.1 PEGA domain-containing protein [bacterium]